VRRTTRRPPRATARASSRAGLTIYKPPIRVCPRHHLLLLKNCYCRQKNPLTGSLTNLKEFATPQIRFLAACSYLPKTAQGLLRQRELLECADAAAIRPEELWEGVERHRIFALAERVLRTHSLTDRLGPFEAALAARAKECQVESLRLFGESMQLSTFFAKHSIEHRFLKGPMLSQKIYGNPGLRHCRDLDLQVRAEDISAAVRLLSSEQWEPTGSARKWEQSQVYRWLAERRLRHFEFVHQRKRLRLELHWRIEPAHTPKLDDLWWARWGSDAATISAAEALHLCLHGASHAWTRLKWIGDLQAILDRQPALWTETRKLGKELDLELIVAMTIFLLQTLFETEPDATASEILRSQPLAPELAKFALESMRLKGPKLYESRAGMMAYGRYLVELGQRLPWRARFGNSLGLCLVDDLELGKWDRHLAWLAAVPLIRASKLAGCYCLNRWGYDPIRKIP
jgi:hypothetical protein